MGCHAGFQTTGQKPITKERSKALSTFIEPQQDRVLQAGVIEAWALLLKRGKNLEQKIVGTAGFITHAFAIPHGTCQTDLINHQLQLEHLLIQALGPGHPRQAAAQQQGQPPNL